MFKQIKCILETVKRLDQIDTFDWQDVVEVTGLTQILCSPFCYVVVAFLLFLVRKLLLFMKRPIHFCNAFSFMYYTIVLL